jgi:superfamily II DNA or RNA helicase
MVTKSSFCDRKTLIALLLIKECSSAFEQGKQTVFLVPSVALAVQQYTVIKVNLPFTVGNVYSAMTYSEAKRKELAACNILVATHGACLDLLNHYKDLFQVSNWNLLILDECHNCTGNSAYASIMRNHYHTTKTEDKPRVMGLTASPLINVKKNHSDEQLRKELANFEKLMDAKIVSLENIGLEEDDEHKGLWLKEADAKLVYYDRVSKPCLMSTTTKGFLCISPDAKNFVVL